ncbi:MAG: hypothetical protein WDA35_00995, partial [Bacilli bacterium]
MNSFVFAASYLTAIAVAFALAGTALFLYFKKNKQFDLNNRLKLLLKISGCILIFSFAIRYLLSDDPYTKTTALINGIFGDNRVANGFSFAIIFLYIPAILIVFVRPFFNLKPIRILNKFFSLPIAGLSLIFLFVLNNAYNGFVNAPVVNWTVTILLAIEVGAFLSTAIIALLIDLKKDNKTNTTKRD